MGIRNYVIESELNGTYEYFDFAFDYWESGKNTSYIVKSDHECKMEDVFTDELHRHGVYDGYTEICGDESEVWVEYKNRVLVILRYSTTPTNIILYRSLLTRRKELKILARRIARFIKKDLFCKARDTNLKARTKQKNFKGIELFLYNQKLQKQLNKEFKVIAKDFGLFYAQRSPESIRKLADELYPAS